MRTILIKIGAIRAAYAAVLPKDFSRVVAVPAAVVSHTGIRSATVSRAVRAVADDATAPGIAIDCPFQCAFAVSQYGSRAGRGQSSGMPGTISLRQAD